MAGWPWTGIIAAVLIFFGIGTLTAVARSRRRDRRLADAGSDYDYTLPL